MAEIGVADMSVLAGRAEKCLQKAVFATGRSSHVGGQTPDMARKDVAGGDVAAVSLTP